MKSGDQDELNEHELVQAGYRFALSLSHDPHDAEDLVQQACYKVISRKGGLVSQGYLFTSIRNLFYDGERRKKIVAFESMAEPPTVVAPEGGLGVEMDLETELGRLRADEREVLFLNFVEGYTAAELAGMLGKPRSTVLSLLSRAKARLFRRRGAEEEPPPAKRDVHG